MEERKEEFLDLWIVRQRRQYRNQNAASMSGTVWYIRDHKIRLNSREIFQGAFIMKLPERFTLMPDHVQQKQYPAMTEPEEIYMDTSNGLYLILQKIVMKEAPDREEYLEAVRQGIREAARGVVIYDHDCVRAVEHEIDYVNYKSFATDDIVYNSRFWLFQDSIVYSGTFQCRFELYDEWQPVIKAMLETVQRRNMVE